MGQNMKNGKATPVTLNRLRVLAKVLETKLDLQQSPKEIVDYIKQSLANYGDPFSEGIEEFMEKQAMDTEDPKELSEEKLEKEGSENPGIEEEAPQEKLEEKLEKKTGDDIEEDKEDLKEKSEENIEGKGTENDEKAEAPQIKKAVESFTNALDKELIVRAAKVAAALMGKGAVVTAQKVLMAAGLDVINTLQELIMGEFRQRDMYEAYDYLLFGSVGIAVQEHLREHMADEMAHATTLQRYITGMGDKPTLDRHPIPKVEPLSFQAILEEDLKLEREAVENYTKAISSLEGLEEFTSLRVELENILIAEQEHVHDIERWLKDYSVVTAAQKEQLELPKPLVGFQRYEDSNTFDKNLARYRRHDHGGGDGDDWLSDSEIQRDYDAGVQRFKSALDFTNAELKKAGFLPNATFELGEKGHFSINIHLEKADQKVLK